MYSECQIEPNCVKLNQITENNRKLMEFCSVARKANEKLEKQQLCSNRFVL